jgi:catechol 2,3-dioxygenase-like lactoylglutathione lyase family enzyme
MKLEIDHVSIIVDDIEKSIAFYRGLLGFQVTSRYYQKNAFDIAFLHDGPASTAYALQLVGPPFTGWLKEIYEKHGPSMDHHAFRIENVDGWYTKLKSVGIDVIEPPRNFLTYRHMYLRDASGTVLELVEYPDPSLSPRMPTKSPSLTGIDYHMNHISILCNDLAEMERFYVDHFGMKNVFDYQRLFILVADPVFLADDTREAVTLEIMGSLWEGEREQTFLTEHGPGLDHICFVVKDVDAAYKNLIAKGVKFHYPPEDSGANRLAFFKDPNGVDVELMMSIPRSSLAV